MPLNLYADVKAFEARFVNAVVADASDRLEIERVLESCSRGTDEYTRRRFYAMTATRVLDGNGRWQLYIPDLLATTDANSIKLDEDGDRVFELTLDPLLDYYLLRHGHEDEDALPKTVLQLDRRNGRRATFLRRPRLVQIAGRWGFGEDREAGSTLNGALDAVATSVVVASGPAFSIGQTVLVDNEQMYISAIATNTLTVVRAVNGTTAATHANAAPVTRYVYVPNVREAVLAWAGQAWKRRETAYSQVLADPAMGTYQIFRGPMPPETISLLGPFVRGDRLVA